MWEELYWMYAGKKECLIGCVCLIYLRLLGMTWIGTGKIV